MTEEQILEVDRTERGRQLLGDILCLRPCERGRHGKLVLREFNFSAPLEEAGEAVTTEPDAPLAHEAALKANP